MARKLTCAEKVAKIYQLPYIIGTDIEFFLPAETKI